MCSVEGHCIGECCILASLYQLAVSAEEMRGMLVEKTSPGPGRW